MNITLYYQRYLRQNFSSSEYFNEILSRIDESYPHKQSTVRTLYFPINHSEVEESKKKGFMVSTYVRDSSLPHLVIEELSIVFENITGDFLEVKDHLIEKFGEHCTRYTVLEEGYLNDIS